MAVLTVMNIEMGVLLIVELVLLAVKLFAFVSSLM